jgi:pimeloyl-ACP methyl ester carboxylesterase
MLGTCRADLTLTRKECAAMSYRPPVVFIPGLLETPDIWAATVQRLGLPEDRVMHLPLPGHDPGDTEGGVIDDLQTNAWIERRAECIAQFSGGKPVKLVGHSSGGLVSLLLARNHPNLVQDLLLIGSLVCGHRDRQICAAAGLMSHPVVGATAFRAMWHYWLRTRTSFVRGVSSSMQQKAAARLAPDTMRRILRRCDPGAVRAFARWVISADITHVLGDVHTPTLALIGKSDPVVPPIHQFRLLRGMPDAQGLLINSGHVPFVETPHRFDPIFRHWHMRNNRAGKPAATRVVHTQSGNSHHGQKDHPLHQERRHLRGAA